MQTKKLQSHRRRRQRRDLGMVIGGRHLHHIHADQIDPGEPAQDRKRLPGEEPADDRRARARRAGRVQPVDIEGQINRAVADDSLDPRGDLVRPRLMTGDGVDDGEVLALDALCRRSGGEGLLFGFDLLFLRT